ncbi:tetratricopeptide repeat protein [Frankia sp. AgB1.9]|uniref:FxSxx-COOH system tetratricopeptide repeat protein n=1 Tax=unclassified Frankia TaxID=2632575 RepID=UPI001934349E|nr:MULTISPECIES: FxSxx-COOH system tetratricopeptide repeat protein [unclassified Frankia]MBL7490361.1 tetratricopeptide repeat protein [Frankia sp. AgW1.1]MBL7548471.1 tetratricopeptide repeat protein [Frankia sp. AgB1.9]MBL7621361.1 tetratricopeptide repeat protein [Frankia sp. AgB1.8]
MDFFVSYTGADEAWATWVAEVLEAEGASVVVQAWDSPAGENFVSWISAQMQAAGRTVAVCSTAYFASHWCTQEWTGALADRKLTPLRIEACSIPAVLGTIGYRDLFDLDEPAARRRLLQAAGVEHPARVSTGFPTAPMAVGPGVAATFPGRLPPVWNVPPRNLLFTGRDVLLDGLRGQLARGSGRVAVAALQGAGGVGKSQLGLEFAWRYAADYQLVWWIDAETPLALTAGLAALATVLGLATGEVPERAAAALAELGRREDWLLIYDNIPAPTTLARRLPPPGGQLLVTCRDPGIGRVGVELVEINEFSRGESVALLRRHIPNLPDEEADQIAATVGDLPLAVDQAGAFLRTGISSVDYLALLAAQPALVLADETLHHPGLAATVTAARDCLAAGHPAAAELLDRLAFLAPEAIPLTPSSPAGTPTPPGRLAAADPYALARMIDAISQLALARRIATALQLHRLVAALLRARLTADQQRTAIAGAVELLATAHRGVPADPVAWPSYAALTPHVLAAASHLTDLADLAEPERFRRLQYDTCQYLNQTGHHRTARALAEAARTRWSATLEPDHPDSLNITTALATALAALGDLHAARALNEDTLTRRRRLLGDDHPATLTCADNLAIRLAVLGELRAARTLAEDTLTRRRRVLGDDHPDTLTSASNLTGVLIRLRKSRAARTLAQDTLTRRRRVLGDDHPDTLASANNLTGALIVLGALQAARTLAEDTLTRRRRVLGDDHPDTLASANNLTAVLVDLGELRAARTLAEDTLTRRRRVLGDDHPHTRRSDGLLRRIREQTEPSS